MAKGEKVRSARAEIAEALPASFLAEKGLVIDQRVPASDCSPGSTVDSSEIEEERRNGQARPSCFVRPARAVAENIRGSTPDVLALA